MLEECTLGAFRRADTVLCMGTATVEQSCAPLQADDFIAPILGHSLEHGPHVHRLPIHGGLGFVGHVPSGIELLQLGVEGLAAVRQPVQVLQAPAGNLS